MKRIDCLDLSTKGKISLYDVQGYFIRGLHQALLNSGMESRLIVNDAKYPGAMIQELIQDPPECTIGFNGVPSNDQQYYVCDDLRIPHVSILIDSPFYFFDRMNAEYAIFTCFDRTATGEYRKMGFERMVFLPHAADASEPAGDDSDRPYDVAMLSSIIDPEQLREAWKEQYSADECRVIEEAAEALVKDPALTCPRAYIQAMNRNRKAGMAGSARMIDILNEIERYLRGRDRIELIRSIKDVRVDVFGSGIQGNWKDAIDQDNVVLHDSVDFKEALAIMRKSKLVLNSCPMILDGAHERVFSGLLAGAALLSSESAYLKEQFPEGSGVRFYQPGKYQGINDQVKGILADEELRKKEVARGRRHVLESHTWEARARQIRDEIGPIVDAMNRKKRAPAG